MTVNRNKDKLERAIRAMQRVQMGFRSMGDEMQTDDARLFGLMGELYSEDKIPWAQVEAGRAFYDYASQVKARRVEWIAWHKSMGDDDDGGGSEHRDQVQWCKGLLDDLVQIERDLKTALRESRKKQYVAAGVALRGAAEEAGSTIRIFRDVVELVEDVAL